MRRRVAGRQVSSVVKYPAAQILDKRTDYPCVASVVAQAHCSTAYLHGAADSLQIHGGIDFTGRRPAQLYFKRARSSETLFSEPTMQRLATLMGI